MNRQAIVEMVLSAYSLAECLSAEEALTDWLRQNQDDFGLYELAGQLGIIKAAAQERTHLSGITASALPILVSVGH